MPFWRQAWQLLATFVAELPLRHPQDAGAGRGFGFFGAHSALQVAVGACWDFLAKLGDQSPELIKGARIPILQVLQSEIWLLYWGYKGFQSSHVAVLREQLSLLFEALFPQFCLNNGSIKTIFSRVQPPPHVMLMAQER